MLYKVWKGGDSIKIIKNILLLCLPVLFSVLILGQLNNTEAYAAESTYPETAKSFYTYLYNNADVNDVLYDPADDTLKYVTRGMIGSSGIRYRTCGWQIRMTLEDGTVLWYVTQRDGGDYVKNIHTETPGDGYEYLMYGIKYSTGTYNLKKLFKSKFPAYATKIDQSLLHNLRFDAVLTIVENGGALGGISHVVVNPGERYILMRVILIRIHLQNCLV